MTARIAAPPIGATRRSRPAELLLAAGRDHALVGAGQLVAGAGNVVFVAVGARLLPPAGFGHLAAFVALLTALSLPGAGLAAAGALSPGPTARLTRRTAMLGAGAGIALVALAGPASRLLGLPVAFILALGAAVPAAPLLGLRRGHAYARRDHRAVVGSLLAEPAARLIVGLGLAMVAGPAGAAWGVAAGGWVALLPLRHRAAAGSGDAAGPDRAVRGRALAATSLAFVVLALLQHQDLIVANRLLDAADGAAFAAVSTIGGMVVFATATIPLVLLPAASRGEPGSVVAAAGAALAIAAGSVAVALVAGEALVLAVVGSAYVDVAPLLVPYLIGMGALGVGRVVAAHRCATGSGRRVARIVAVVAVAQVAGLLALARTPGQVVAVTTAALITGTGVLALPHGWSDLNAPSPWRRRLGELARRPDARLLFALSILALLIRLATERSFWIDEALSVRQAQMPLGDLWANLRDTDVHPPLHFLVLWGAVRTLGTAEWAVRLPSVLAGVALVPVLYGATRELFDARTARIAAALAVPAPFLVWYSQEARMYALFMLIGVLALWAQVCALRRGRPSAFVAWGVASAALLWTQWFAVLPLAVQQIATVVHLVRRRRSHPTEPPLVLRWLGSLAVTAALVAPLAPFLLDQLHAYGERGAGLSMPTTAGTDSSTVAGGLSSYAVIANLLWGIGGYHSDDVMLHLGALWPLAALGALLLLGRRLQPITWLVAAVALVPAAALFVIAHSKRDLFELRYFVLAAPLLLMLVARATTTLARRRGTLGALAGALLVVSSVALADQQLNGTNPRLYDFRGAAAAIERTSGPGDVLAYAPSYLDGVLAYYAPDLSGRPLGELDPNAVDGDIYVVVAERFVTRASAARVGDELARIESARGVPQRIERPNVVVWRFS